MCLSYRELSDKEVATRKAHRCEWCAGRIHKGERARNRNYVFDGQMVSGYMHLDCYEGFTQSDGEVVCEGWMPGDFERGETAA
jgi:hypothetical protein